MNEAGANIIKFCNIAIVNCANPFKIQLAECQDRIKVWAGLAANTNYAWLITDKYGNEYFEYFVSDGSGNFSIDVTDTVFPDGLFNYAAGYFTMQIFQYFPYYYYNGDAETLTFCGGEYDSVLFSFQKRSSPQDQSIQFIKCES